MDILDDMRVSKLSAKVFFKGELFLKSSFWFVYTSKIIFVMTLSSLLWHQDQKLGLIQISKIFGIQQLYQT